MGTLFKKKGSKQWQMGVSIGGRQICRSAHTVNKNVAKRLLARWETEVFERRFHLPQSMPPYFEDWADKLLTKMAHPNTRKRYTSSVRKLKDKFAGVRLSDISADRIDEYVEERMAEGVEPATINHDLRVLRKMMRRAESKQLITRNPFLQVEFLEQPLRDPHIVTYEEEERILKVAVPYIRMLVVLILETGMRSHREALPIRWDAIDFVNDLIRVRESKTRAGIRNVPLSARCKKELLHWRAIAGLGYSLFVFPNLRTPSRPMKGVRETWAKALKDAGIEHFWIYNLRHTFASRMSAAGVPDLFVAQLIGHSTVSTLHKYSRAIDEYRRDAVHKLEQMRASHAQRETIPTSIN